MNIMWYSDEAFSKAEAYGIGMGSGRRDRIFGRWHTEEVVELV